MTSEPFELDDTSVVSAQDSEGVFEPRIYVACLASYNNGVYHGTWIDADDVDDMTEAIAAMLRASPYPNVMIDCPGCPMTADDDDSGPCVCQPCPLCDALDSTFCTLCKQCTRCGESGHGKVSSAEEWAIHDYDGFGELGSSLGEHPSLEAVAMHARGIYMHGDAWHAYCDWQDTDYQSEDDFEDRYYGEYDSAADYAEDTITECYDLGGVPEAIRHHIDWDGIANDMRLSGEMYFPVIGGKTYAFSAG